MNHMSKMLRFRDMRLFLIPIPTQEALLRARYASLRFARNNNMVPILVGGKNARYVST